MAEPPIRWNLFDDKLLFMEKEDIVFILKCGAAKEESSLVTIKIDNEVANENSRVDFEEFNIFNEHSSPERTIGLF